MELTKDAGILLALIRRQEPEIAGLSDMEIIEETLALRVAVNVKKSSELRKLALEG